MRIPQTTLRGWAGRNETNPDSKQVPAELVEAGALKLADQYESITEKINRRVLASVDTVPVETSADVKNLLIGAGIATEKASFARGGPTSRESREIRIVYGLDPSITSLRELGERTVSGQKALPEPIEGEIVSQE